MPGRYFWKILSQPLKGEAFESDCEVFVLLPLDEIKDDLLDLWPWDKDAAGW